MKKYLKRYVQISALSLIITACGGSNTPVESTEMEEVIPEETNEEAAMEEAPSMTLIAVEHTVADFDVWYAGYKEKSDPDSRIGVLVSIDDPTLVHVAEKTESHESARARLNSDEFKGAMAELGVTSEPSIRYMTLIEMNKDEMKDDYRVAIWHQVKDFDTWKIKFDEDEAQRSEAGLSLLGLGTLESDPSMVFMMFSCTDVEKVKGMLSDPKMKEVMEAAGVISEPDASYWRLPEAAM